MRAQRVSIADHQAAVLRSGASEGWAQGVADMARALEEQGFYGVSRPSAPDTAPTGFRQWCEEVLKPALLA